MKRYLLFLIAAFALFAAPVDAQKRCVKGKPCGNTCIAANKTCRVSAGSSSSARPAAKTPPPAPATPSDARFVASSRGQVYYLVGCNGAAGLSPANRIYFKSEQEAVAAGYRPSTARGCSTGAAVATPPASSHVDGGLAVAGECVISRVYDGDTLTCRAGESIRLLLIDAPEMDQGEFGRKSRTVLLELAPLGSTVRLEHDVETQDRYGRTLAYIWLPDGRLLNEELVKRGYALGLTYPPNVKYVNRIEAAVADARRARVGLWGVDGFRCAPADHRADRCQ